MTHNPSRIEPRTHRPFIAPETLGRIMGEPIDIYAARNAAEVEAETDDRIYSAWVSGLMIGALVTSFVIGIVAWGLA